MFSFGYGWFGIDQGFHYFEGLIDEVDHFYQRGDLSPQLPSMRSVGYRQVWAYLDGQYDYDKMEELGIVATRQVAKRQLTWLRGLDTITTWPCEDPSHQQKLLDYVREALNR